jgi:quercetin dioxygenase-like cupin family protein
LKNENCITVGQLHIKYLQDGSKEKQIGAFELTVPPNSNVPPPHSHSENEEYVYVLEGKLRYSMDSVTKDLAPGESRTTSKEAVYAFSNPFEAPARALVVLSPDIGAQYFHDVATVINAGGPPDRAKLLQVMSNYGLKPAASTPAAT